jgi:hypothetical protein
MPDYVLPILRLVGWAAYVAGVFWLTRVAARRVSLTASKRKLALYAISVGGVMLNLVVYKTVAGLLPQPFDLALLAAVGFGAIAMFFAHRSFLGTRQRLSPIMAVIEGSAPAQQRAAH